MSLLFILLGTILYLCLGVGIVKLGYWLTDVDPQEVDEFSTAAAVVFWPVASVVVVLVMLGWLLVRLVRL